MNRTPEEFQKLEKYGMIHTFFGEQKDGVRVNLNIKFAHGEVTLEDFWYTRETHEEAFRKAGFKNLEWSQWKPNESLNAQEREHWHDFETISPTIFFKAVKE